LIKLYLCMSGTNETPASAFTKWPTLSCTFDEIPIDAHDIIDAPKTPQKTTKLDECQTLRGKRLAAYYAHLMSDAFNKGHEDTDVLRPKNLFFGP
jgi:hypothetical protein